MCVKKSKAHVSLTLDKFLLIILLVASTQRNNSESAIQYPRSRCSHPSPRRTIDSLDKERRPLSFLRVSVRTRITTGLLAFDRVAVLKPRSNSERKYVRNERNKTCSKYYFRDVNISWINFIKKL